MRNFILAFLLVSACADPVAAQPSGEALVSEIQRAYRSFEYEEAQKMGREALQRYSQFTVEQLTEIHTLLGLAAYDQGQLSESRRQFLSALHLSPDLELDPLLTSPKIVEFFDGIASEMAAGDAAVGESPIRYVVLRDRRTDAAVRSMVLPGWGQFYKGHNTKGWIISGLFGASAAGAVAAHLKRGDAERVYAAETNPSLVEDRYAAYNRWHKTRSALIQGAAAVWAVGYVDALLTNTAFEGERHRFTLHTSPRSVSLSLRF